MQIFSARAENGGWLILNSKLRIGNAYTQCGRIANSPERPVAGCFLIRESALKMLILRTGELQIRPNGEKGVPLLGRNLANRSKSCKSVLPRKGRKRCWLISNPKKCIGNAYTQDGRIANSPERGMDGFAITGILVAYGEKSCKSMQIIQIFFLFLYLCCDMRLTMTV